MHSHDHDEPPGYRVSRAYNYVTISPAGCVFPPTHITNTTCTSHNGYNYLFLRNGYIATLGRRSYFRIAKLHAICMVTNSW